MKILKTDLLASNDRLETRVANQSKELRDLTDRCKGHREKITKLKAVARHYKTERDKIDAYLSGILDLVIEKEEVEVPDGHNGQWIGPVRKEKGIPPMMRPGSSEPWACSPDPYFSNKTETHWEDY